MKRITRIRLYAPCLALALLLSSCGGKAAKKEVEIGMSQDEVTKLLGSPDQEESENWYYFDDAFAKKYRQLEKLLESDSPKDWEKAEKISEEMDKMHMQFTLISFAGSGKTVSTYLFDKDHKYDPGDDYSCWSKKSVASSYINGEDKVYTYHDGAEEKEVPLIGEGGYLKVSFTDGSLYKSSLGSLWINQDQDGTSYSSLFTPFGSVRFTQFQNVGRTDKYGNIVSWDLDQLDLIPDGLGFDGSFVSDLISKGKTYKDKDGNEYFGPSSNPYRMLLRANKELTHLALADTTEIIRMDAIGSDKATSIDFGSHLRIVEPYGISLGSADPTEISFPDTLEEVGHFGIRVRNPSSIRIPEGIRSFEARGLDYDFVNDFESNPAIHHFGAGYYIGNEENPYLVLVKKEISYTDTEFLLHPGCKLFQYVDYEIDDSTSLLRYPIPIRVDGEGKYFEEIEGALYDKSHEKLVRYNDREATSFVPLDSVKEIGEYAFYRREKLVSLTLPSFVSKLGEGAFARSGIAALSLPDSVSAIPDLCFELCAIKSVRLPAYLNSIGYGAFEDSGLQSVVLPDWLDQLGERAFYSCDALENVHLSESLISLPAACFSGCEALKKIALPEGMTSVGPDCFAECLGLEEVRIPSTLMEIGENGFAFTYGNLTAFIVSEDNPVFVSLGGCLYNKITHQLLSVAQATEEETLVIEDPDFDWNGMTLEGARFSRIELPEGLRSIPRNAFARCPNLKEVVLPSTLESIGDYAFWCCDALESVVIPGKITEIPAHAFAQCSALSSVSLPNGLLSIGEEAFTVTSSLKQIDLPDSLQTIGKRAFSGSGLTSLSIGPSVSSIGEEAFSLASLQAIEVDAANPNFRVEGYYLLDSANAVVAQVPVKQWSGDVVVPEGVTSVSAYGNENITSVRIPSTATYFSFATCPNLTEVVIAEGVKTIPQEAFEGCQKLASATLPSTLEIIGSFAFGSCSSLTSINFPSALYSIGYQAFYGCSALAKVDLRGTALTSLPKEGFWKCSALSELHLPKGLQTIGSHCFRDCMALKAVDFFACPLLTTLTGFAYTGLEEVTIPNTVEKLTSAFAQCHSLRKVTFEAGSKLNEIGESSFYGTALDSIVIPGSVETIGNSAFKGCKALSEVLFEAGGAIGISNQAFYGCSALQSVDLSSRASASLGEICFAALKEIHLPATIQYLYPACLPSSLSSLLYDGTIAEWNAVPKDPKWCTSKTLTITCSDGVVA